MARIQWIRFCFRKAMNIYSLAITVKPAQKTIKWFMLLSDDL